MFCISHAIPNSKSPELGLLLIVIKFQGLILLILIRTKYVGCVSEYLLTWLKPCWKILFINDVHIVTLSVYYGWNYESQSRSVSSDQLSEPFDTGSFLSTFIPPQFCHSKPISYRPWSSSFCLPVVTVLLVSAASCRKPVVQGLNPWLLSYCCYTYATWSVGARNLNSAGPDPGTRSKNQK